MATVSRTICYRHTVGAYVGHTAAMKLTYDDAAPFDVTVDFGPDAQEPWRIWRDILARRVDGKAVAVADDDMAEGGVNCEVDGMWAYLTLAGWDRAVTIRFFAGELDAFLRETENLVPAGAEAADIDAELAQLLGGAR